MAPHDDELDDQAYMIVGFAACALSGFVVGLIVGLILG